MGATHPLQSSKLTHSLHNLLLFAIIDEDGGGLSRMRGAVDMIILIFQIRSSICIHLLPKLIILIRLSLIYVLSLVHCFRWFLILLCSTFWYFVLSWSLHGCRFDSVSLWWALRMWLWKDVVRCFNLSIWLMLSEVWFLQNRMGNVKCCCDSICLSLPIELWKSTNQIFYYI